MILEDALEANDLIADVFQKYQQLILKHQPNSNRNESDSSLIPNVNSRPQNTMDELSEIFSSQGHEVGALLTPTTTASLDLLEPTLALSADVKLDSQGKYEHLYKFRDNNKFKRTLFFIHRC